METTEKLICITCPKGCTLEVTHDGQTVLKVEGSGCKRGKDYVERELKDPRPHGCQVRVRVRGGIHPLLTGLHLRAFPQTAYPGIARRATQN